MMHMEAALSDVEIEGEMRAMLRDFLAHLARFLVNVKTNRQPSTVKSEA